MNFNAFWNQETTRGLIPNKIYCLHLSNIRKVTCEIIYSTENFWHYFNLCWTPLLSPPYLTLSQYFSVLWGSGGISPGKILEFQMHVGEF